MADQDALRLAADVHRAIEHFRTLANNRRKEFGGSEAAVAYDRIADSIAALRASAAPVGDGELRDALRHEVHDAFLEEAESNALPLLDRVLAGIDAVLAPVTEQTPASAPWDGGMPGRSAAELAERRRTALTPEERTQLEAATERQRQHMKDTGHDPSLPSAPSPAAMSAKPYIADLYEEGADMGLGPRQPSTPLLAPGAEPERQPDGLCPVCGIGRTYTVTRCTHHEGEFVMPGQLDAALAATPGDEHGVVEDPILDTIDPVGEED